jgi:hypothetical protein
LGITLKSLLLICRTLRRNQSCGVLVPSNLFTALNGPIIGDRDGVRWIARRAKSLTTTARTKDGDLLESESKGAHELGAAGCSDAIVVPVRLVLDGDRQGELVEVADTGDTNVEVGLEVARVIRMADEFLHLQAKELDIFERRIVGDVQVDALKHSLATGDVVDPKIVQDNVGDLKHC